MTSGALGVGALRALGAGALGASASRKANSATNCRQLVTDPRLRPHKQESNSLCRQLVTDPRLRPHKQESKRESSTMLTRPRIASARRHPHQYATWRFVTSTLLTYVVCFPPFLLPGNHHERYPGDPTLGVPGSEWVYCSAPRASLRKCARACALD